MGHEHEHENDKWNQCICNKFYSGTYEEKKCKNQVLTGSCQSLASRNVKKILFQKLCDFEKLIAVSKEVQEELHKYKIPRKKIVRINNGVDVNTYKSISNIAPLYQEFEGIKKSIVVGTVGRLSNEKGHANLLMAASRILEKKNDICFF